MLLCEFLRSYMLGILEGMPDVAKSGQNGTFYKYGLDNRNIFEYLYRVFKKM